MEVELTHVEYQEQERRIVATVSYGEETPTECWNRAKVSLFLDWTDSYEELKRNALAAARDFLARAAEQDHYFVAPD